MKCFLSLYDDHIVVVIPVASGDINAAAEQIIYPGESFFGLPYDDLRNHGAGQVDLDVEIPDLPPPS